MPEAKRYTLGLEAKLFFGAAGSTATTEMKNVKDVTLKEASVEFEMIWDTADSGFNAIRKAYFGSSALSLFVSDGEGNGLDADFVVTSFSRSEPLEEALKVSVTCKPTLVSRAPTWVSGGGS